MMGAGGAGKGSSEVPGPIVNDGLEGGDGKADDPGKTLGLLILSFGVIFFGVMRTIFLKPLVFLITVLPLVGQGTTEGRIGALETEVRELHALVEQLGREIRSLRGGSAEVRPATAPTGYVVQAGDTLGEIANRHGFGIQEMLAVNPEIDPRRLQIGERLTFPGGMRSVARASTPSGGSHTVQSGETFSGIAQRHGVSTAELIASNPGIPPTRLRVGTSLRIPGGNSVRTASQPAPGNPQVATRASSKPRPDPVDYYQPKQAGQQLVAIETPTRYIDLARRYQTSVLTLNRLNKIQLSANQLIAAGSEIYVPR